MQRLAQLQPCREQGNDDGDFRQHLQDLPMRDGVQREPAKPREGPPQQKVNHGHTDRGALDCRAAQHDQQKHDADERIPILELAHGFDEGKEGWTLPAPHRHCWSDRIAATMDARESGPEVLKSCQLAPRPIAAPGRAVTRRLRERSGRSRCASNCGRRRSGSRLALRNNFPRYKSGRSGSRCRGLFRSTRRCRCC